MVNERRAAPGQEADSASAPDGVAGAANASRETPSPSSSESNRATCSIAIEGPNASVVNAIFRIFVYPLIAIVQTLLYYDARIRKEGYDLELMAQDLGAPAAQAAR